MSPFRFLLPIEYQDGIAASPAKHGTFDISLAKSERLIVIVGWGYRSFAHGDVHRRGASALHDQHFVGAASEANGFWYRVSPEWDALWHFAAQRNACLPAQVLRDAVTGWHAPGRGETTTPILTLATSPGGGVHAAAWIIQADQLVPAALDVVDVAEHRLAPLRGQWPTPDLQDAKIVAVGAGSIGTAAAQALLTYGARRLSIVDPDSLVWRNFARHPAPRSEVGRLKVNAVSALLGEYDPRACIRSLPVDVIYDADLVRDELLDAEAMLVCVDGVEPRRVANHLAVRAGVPAVFACVLDNGRVGEILRVLPRKHECLLCQRERLAAAGALQLEAALDRGNGRGTRKLPMTAVGGDLALVGQLAAKITVATILERAGHRDQRLPGEHATIGLRPAPDLPAPFDPGLGQVQWAQGHSPKPDCPTCRWS